MRTLLSLLAFLLLSSGCTSNKIASKDIIILPKSQQEAYLSRAKPTELFGFTVFGQPNGSVGVREKLAYIQIIKQLFKCMKAVYQ